MEKEKRAYKKKVKYVEQFEVTEETNPKIIKQKKLLDFLSRKMGKLHDYQRDLIIDVVARIFNRETVVRSDYPTLGLHWREYPANIVANILGVTTSTVNTWTRDGKNMLQKTEAGRFDMGNVVRWLIARETEKYKHKEAGIESLKRKQLQGIVEMKQIQIAKEKGSVVQADYHEAVLSSRIGNLRNWLEVNFDREFFKLANKTVEELRPAAKDLRKQMMDAYVGGSKGIERGGK